MSQQSAFTAQETQLYTRLYLKKYDQQVKRGNPTPLLCAGETSSGVLHPDVESSVQERHGLIERIQRRATKRFQGMKNLSYEGRLRAGAVQMEKRREGCEVS